MAFAQDYYGAIAYSYETKAHGWSKDHPSRAAAEKAALAGCAKLAQDCKPVLWFRNACGALATGSQGPGWEWAEDQVTADRRAIAACAQHSKACTVKRRVCTQGKK
ncbi:MAG: DUF4189 domain-containing protein [Burkholderiales bacterium]